jgi:hypothetical protein
VVKKVNIETFKPKRPPLKQGILDSFCSIYSVENAVSYLNPEFNYKKAQALFYDMVYKIYEGRSAMPEIQEILTEGSHRLPFCCLEGTPYELKHHRPYFRKNKRPKTVNELMDSLGALVNRPDRCAIIVLENQKQDWSHYTVVWGIDAQGLHLLDSGSMGRIIKPHQLVIDDSEEKAPAGRRFKLFPAEVFIVETKH